MKRNIPILLLTTTFVGTSLLSTPRDVRAQESEADLLKTLSDPDAPIFDKAMACKELSRIGTEAAVPVLAEMLGDDETLSHYARYALVLMPSPMAPHLCEELWERLGHTETILGAGFPELDENALEVKSVTLAVQVNGKVRTRVEVPVGSDSAEIERQVLELPQVVTFLDGRAPRKVIVVPNRLVNVVG